MDKIDLNDYVRGFLPFIGESFEDLVRIIEEHGYTVEGYTYRGKKPSDGRRVDKNYVVLKEGFKISANGYVQHQGRDLENRKQWAKKTYVRKSLNIPKDLYEAFDSATGGVPFQTWVKEQMEKEIKGKKGE